MSDGSIVLEVPGMCIVGIGSRELPFLWQNSRSAILLKRRALGHNGTCVKTIVRRSLVCKNTEQTDTNSFSLLASNYDLKALRRSHILNCRSH